MRLLAAIACGILLAAPAEARRKRHHPQDPRTEGLGRNCKLDSACGHKAQVCLRQSDANGQPMPHGFCALPCAPIDEGLKKDDPAPELGSQKDAPPRCPKRYQCRSKGGGVPIDMCMKQ